MMVMKYSLSERSFAVDTDSDAPSNISMFSSKFEYMQFDEVVVV